MVSMDLRDIGGSQYTAVTGRKWKTPYTAILTGQSTALQDAARQKTLDDLREKELADTARRFDATQALEREKMAAAKGEAIKSNIITGTGLAMGGAYLADRAGLISLKDIAGAKTTGNAGATLLPGAKPFEGATLTEGAGTVPTYGEVMAGAEPLEGATLTEGGMLTGSTEAGAAAGAGETGAVVPGAAAYALPALAGYVLGGKIGKSGTGKDIGEKILLGRGGEREHAAVTGAVVGGLAGWGAEAAMVALGLPGVGLPVAIGLGGLSGAVSGGCIIVTACTGRESPEVQIAREYRDKYLDHDALKGYYMIADRMVPQMEQDEKYREFVKKTLVDPLLEYGRFCLGLTRQCSGDAAMVANDFIEKCRSLGRTVESYTRTNGEVI